jgi:hypothetical protein
MHFWNIEALKKQLKETGLSEKQVFGYILIYVTLTALGMEAMSYLPTEEAGLWDHIAAVANVAIAVGGTILAFSANGGANGRDFAARYFSIGFVATIRFMVLLIPIVGGMMVYWTASFESEGEIATSPVEVVVFGVWAAALYLYIARHMRQTAAAGAA